MAKTPQGGNAKRHSASEIEEFRKFLGPIASHYSECELPQLRREVYAMAEILLDFYLEKKRHDVSVCRRPAQRFDREPTNNYDEDNPIGSKAEHKIQTDIS